MEDRQGLYFISSIYLNAYILSKGFEIEKTGILDNCKVALFYKKSDKLFNAIQEYKDNKELGEFVTCYLKVKDIINLHKWGDTDTTI